MPHGEHQKTVINSSLVAEKQAKILRAAQGLQQEGAEVSLVPMIHGSFMDKAVLA